MFGCSYEQNNTAEDLLRRGLDVTVTTELCCYSCESRLLLSSFAACGAQTCSQPFLIGPYCSLDIAQKRTLWSKCADNEHACVSICRMQSVHYWTSFLVGGLAFSAPSLCNSLVQVDLAVHARTKFHTRRTLFLSDAHADVLARASE